MCTGFPARHRRKQGLSLSGQGFSQNPRHCISPRNAYPVKCTFPKGFSNGGADGIHPRGLFVPQNSTLETFLNPLSGQSWTWKFAIGGNTTILQESKRFFPGWFCAERQKREKKTAKKQPGEIPKLGEKTIDKRLEKV